MEDFELPFEQLGESNDVALLSDEISTSSSSDDDCVILDIDPSKKPVLVVNGKKDDDLKIIGEKGEVACRDYPHPRYLCAKFPFASAPHELHCSQCHCYVCDSPAPCSHWDTNMSSIDHCHATYKEECWRAERILVKNGDTPLPPVLSIHSLFQIPEFPKLDLPEPKPLPPNQGSYTVTTNSSSVSGSNGVVQGGVHQSGFSGPMSNPQSHLVSPQLYPTFSNSNIASSSRDNNNNNNNNNTRTVRSLSSQSIPRRASFKRSGRVGSLNHRYGYGPQLPMDPSLMWSHAFETPMVNVGHGSNQLNIGSHVASFVLPQPESSQMWASPYSSPTVITDLMNFQFQMAYVNANLLRAENFHNWILPGPGVAFGPSHVVGLQSAVFTQSYVSDALGHQLAPSMPMMSTRFDMVNEFESLFLQPRALNNYPATLLVNRQNDIGQGNHRQNGVGVSSTNFGSVWASFLGHENQQISSRGFRIQNHGTSCLFTITNYNEKWSS